MDCKNMKFKLRSGNYMPLIGFGTYQIRGRELIKSVLEAALVAGYRQIDTAAVYGNEIDIGLALQELLPKYNLKRKDIFITSKLSPNDQGDQALKALENSIKNLKCEYLDLYLIHWPGASSQGRQSNSNKSNSELRDASWACLVQGVHKGIVKDIGVSNYLIRHLTELIANNHGIKPAVNQVEWHPHCHSTELREYCQKEGILLQAYSSLGGTNNEKLIADPSVKNIAQKLGKTEAQVLLRWALQQDIGIIPKARARERIENNINLNFTIPDLDMNTLNSLGNERYAWNPESID